MGKQIVRTCEMKVEAYPDGDYDAKPIDNPENIEACKEVMDEMNPRMGRVWKRHLTDDGKEKLGIEIEDKKDEFL